MSGFPVGANISTCTIDGVDTEIACLSYRDVINIHITQLNKIGCVVRARRDFSITNKLRSNGTEATNDNGHSSSTANGHESNGTEATNTAQEELEVVSFDVDSLVRSRDTRLATTLARMLVNMMHVDGCGKSLILSLALKASRTIAPQDFDGYFDDAQAAAMMHDIGEPLLAEIRRISIWRQ